MEIAPKQNPVIQKKVVIPILIALFLLLLLCLGAIIVHMTGNTGKIYANIYILDENVGGMSQNEAISLLTERYGTVLRDKSVTLRMGNKSVPVAALDIEATVDIPATVDLAYQTGREGSGLQNTITYFRHKTTSHNQNLSVSYNPSVLLSLLDQIAADSEVAVSESFYSVTGGVLTIDRGKSGLAVDRDAFREMFTGRLSSLDFSDITIELKTVEPSPIDFDEMYAQITLHPEDAYYATGDPDPIVIGGREQVLTGKHELESQISGSRNHYEIPVSTIKPDKTGEYLTSCLFRDELSKATTSFAGSSWDRSSNVNLTATRINNTVLMPGETFSYDEAVGPRTPQNGYRLANVYINNKVEVDYGGGICQTSSTLYTAVLYANLEIVERVSHSLPVAYLPGGQDATIASGSIDFKFRNDTEFPVKILANTNGALLTVSILGTNEKNQTVKLFHSTYNYTTGRTVEEYDASIPVGTKRIKQSGGGGYSVASTRKVYIDGNEVKSETLPKSVYHPMDRIELINPADKGKPLDPGTNNPAGGDDTPPGTDPTPSIDPPTPVAADPTPDNPPALSIDDV